MKSGSIRIVSSIAFAALTVVTAVAGHELRADKLRDDAHLVKLDPKASAVGTHLAKLDSRTLGHTTDHGVKEKAPVFPALAKLCDVHADKLGDTLSHAKVA